MRLPGDNGPWGRWGTYQHGELAVVEGHSARNKRLLAVTSFPLIAGRVSVSLWTIRSATISQRRVAIKVAGLDGFADLTSEFRFDDKLISNKDIRLVLIDAYEIGI